MTLLLAGAALCLAQQSGGPAILRPAADSVVPPGPLVVVARAPAGAELMLDGQKIAAQQPAAGAISATIRPSAGRHELTLKAGAAQQTIAFFAGAGAPSGWKAYRAHPPQAACDTCHVARDGAWALQHELPGPSCFGCHDVKAFVKPHTHNPEVLAECQLCHDPHGSTAKGHMKMTREIACKACHG